MEDNLADVLSIREGVEPYAAANMIYTLRIMPKSKYCEERRNTGAENFACSSGSLLSPAGGFGGRAPGPIRRLEGPPGAR